MHPLKRGGIDLYKEIWKQPQDIFNEQSKVPSSVSEWSHLCTFLDRFYICKYVTIFGAAKEQKTKTRNGLNNKIFLYLIIYKTKSGVGFKV